MEYDSRKLFILLVLFLTSFTIQAENKNLYLLARIIFAEAGHEKSYVGKLAVGNVVLNRAERKKCNIAKVIYQKGQFDGVRGKNFKYKYKTDKMFKVCLQAAKELLEGRRVLPNTVEFFHNPKTSTDSKWLKTIEKHFFIDIGNHRFCHNPNVKKIKRV